VTPRKKSVVRRADAEERPNSQRSTKISADRRFLNSRGVPDPSRVRKIRLRFERVGHSLAGMPTPFTTHIVSPTDSDGGCE